MSSQHVIGFIEPAGRASPQPGHSAGDAAATVVRTGLWYAIHCSGVVICSRSARRVDEAPPDHRRLRSAEGVRPASATPTAAPRLASGSRTPGSSSWKGAAGGARQPRTHSATAATGSPAPKRPCRMSPSGRRTRTCAALCWGRRAAASASRIAFVLSCCDSSSRCRCSRACSLSSEGVALKKDSSGWDMAAGGGATAGVNT
mmetsp:Transcript_17641/g.38487  ORF Transcript_17641/g.38487 Transcript_17641/m.38487 type:complete len:202 (-) Transcript_17641:1155-1760(-)